LIQSVTLRDNVTFEIDPKFAAGLEEFRADEVTLIGEHTIVMSGGVMSGGKLPVRAVRRGELEAFGLGDRVLDLTAPEIRLHLDGNLKNSTIDPLTRVEFLKGVTLRDRDGPGRFSAGSLAYDVRAGTLLALQGVAASAPGRAFKSDAAFVTYIKDTKTVGVTLTGKKTVSMRMAGRIGPLAQAANDLYTFSCNGSLVITSTETTHGLRARGSVLVRSKKTPILSCDDLVVKIRGDKMRSLVATGSVIGNDAATGTTLTSDRLEYREDHDVPRAVVLNGRPATVTAPDRVLRGNHLEYAEGGAFNAMGDVWADIVLPQGRWKFSCDYAEGIVPQDGGVPPHVLVGGKVRADGPDGERVEADRVRFSKKTGRLTLDGSPAKLRQGVGLVYEGASLALDVVKDAAGYRVSSGKTEGAAKIRVIPQKATVQNVASWRVDLKGAADFKNDILRIPKGADVEGFDAAGKRVIVVRGAAFEFEFKNMRPLVVRCSGGMDGETFKGGKRSTRLVAEGFRYRLDSNNIDLRGPGEIWQGNAKEPTRFREAELEVVADGVKFKYLKKLEAPLTQSRKK